MAVRGRVNRSGSDPVGTPYRPDSSWASLSNSNNMGQRFNRDSRSMSLDSNMNNKALTGSAAAAAAAVANNMNYNNTSYYNNGSGYGGYTNGNRHNTLNNRHSAEFSRSSGYMGYEMYTNTSTTNTTTDGTIPPQQQQQQHYHNSRLHHQPNLNSLYENNHNNHHNHNHSHSHHHPQQQAPYGQMYSSGYATYPPPTTPAVEEKEPNQSFSTPQPHYRRIPTNTSPTMTSEKYSASTSPSPPQPDNKRPSKKSCSVGNEYDWMD